MSQAQELNVKKVTTGTNIKIPFTDDATVDWLVN